jgi:hypothetical protein
MVDAVPGAGSPKRFGKLNKIPKLAKTILIIAVLGVAAYFIWNHFHSNSSNISTVNGVVSIPQLDKLSEKQAAGYLDAQDYASYQFDRQTLATNYLENKDYANAERIMNGVLKNVPSDKITERSYSVLAQIEKAKGNTSLEKKYLSLMITGLKQEGKTDAAAAAQQELDSLK